MKKKKKQTQNAWLAKKRKKNVKDENAKSWSAGGSNPPIYLEHGQQALIETVKVASGFLSQRVIVKSCAKDLHPEKRKDTHEYCWWAK